ncbi:MAG: thioesterase family protein [Bacteroidales bacterium]|nr:thioesterase family protein [Bacteroidales bacterium]
MNKYDFNTTDFKHKEHIQMRFSDLDAMNHVNNGYQMHYYDVGRINYCETVLGRRMDWTKDFMVIVHLELDFIASIEMGMDVVVETKTVGFGSKSMKMFQRIIDNNTGDVKSTCFTILSGIDRVNHCSQAFPEEFKQTFLDFEAR